MELKITFRDIPEFLHQELSEEFHKLAKRHLDRHVSHFAPDSVRLRIVAEKNKRLSDHDSISPATQSWWERGEQSIAAYYSATPDRIRKVKGTLIGPDHLDLLGRPSCSAASFRFMCTYGVYGYLGYPTAWMMAELQGDTYAAHAFTGSGEMFSETTNWEYVDSNIP